MKTKINFNATLMVTTLALVSTAFTWQPQKTEASSISFYVKWKVLYQQNSGTETKTFNFITDVKTISGDDDCLNYKIYSDLNGKMHEQVAYNFPDLVKQSGWHNLDGGNRKIEIVKNESKNEADRLRRNDITSIRESMKDADKLNNFIFDLDDLSCDN